MLEKLKYFLNPFDRRYEDLHRGPFRLNVLRDFTAGLIVAMVAIPLAMGFAIASGLRPEQGIIGGALAGIVGALFGGSKYQVYGPTAAFIPIIGAVMAAHDHRFLVLCSIVAAIVLVIMSLTKVGKIVNLVPHSIIVGFTIGIAVTIALSLIGEMLGLKSSLGYSFFDKIRGVWANIEELRLWALGLAVGTLVLSKLLLKVSVFIPAPLIALGAGTVLSMTLLADQDLALIKTKYGSIPAESWAFTPPRLEDLSAANLGTILYYATAIVFVSAIESLLCSRMADRLANNKGTPFHPDKELWGQGIVNLLVPLANGFPHTGALARTATNIKLGALSPLAGIFKAVLKLAMAFYLARYLELIPMACIGGILVYVAINMVKPAEIDEVVAMGRGHVALMVYTAVAVIVTDFLTGVLTALVVYAVLKPKAQAHAAQEATHGLRKPSWRPESAVRAVLDRSRASARHPAHTELAPTERRRWLTHIRQRALVAPTAFVHPQATVIGRVVLGEHVHIAAGSSVRADEGSPFFIGANSNIQDGVVIHALKGKYVSVHGEPWAVYVGRNVSMAHNALVHGPCYIGDDTFIGFKAVIHDAVVGSNCFVGIGATVVGVEIPDGKFVPHGMIVDSAEKVKSLPPASEAHGAFNEDVVEVNRGLAEAYRAHDHAAATPWGAVALPRAASATAGWGPPRTARSYDSPRLDGLSEDRF